MTVKAARNHEIRCQDVGAAENRGAGSLHETLDRSRRSEGIDSTTSTHQDRTVFERNDDDDDIGDDNEDGSEGKGDDEDDEDDNNDNNDNHDAASIVNFLRG